MHQHERIEKVEEKRVDLGCLKESKVLVMVDGLKRFLMGGKVLVGFWVTKGWVVYKEVYNLF